MNIHPTKQQLLSLFDEPKSLDDLGNGILKYFKNTVHRDHYGNDVLINIVGLSWELKYTDTIITTHCAPLGKSSSMTNPESLPGFTGRIWLRTESDFSGWLSKTISKCVLHPGSGGVGSYDGPWKNVNAAFYNEYGPKPTNTKIPKPIMYSWDCKIFLDDLPLIKQYIENHKLMSTLKSELYSFKHSFLWNDPETAERDENYLTCKL